MPIYCYEDENTGYRIDIMRSFAEYKALPTEEDLPPEEKGKDRKWTKIIAPVGPFNLWPTSGGPGKGNWGRQ